MYKVKNIVYSDGGKLLISDKFKGYSHVGNLEDFIEIEINLNLATIENNIITFDDLAPIYINETNSKYSYGDWKAHIIKTRYSNDDQIAIMLNKDSGDEEDILRYNKMQEWREWSSQLAHKILEILNINNN